MRIRKLFVGLSLCFLFQTSSADTILYTLDDLGGGQWQYNYTVENTGAVADPLDAFSVFFDFDLFSDLSVTASPTDWISEAFQPDPFLPDDGFFDSFTVVDALDLGEMLGGFSVAFTFLGTGTPGDQFFQFFDLDFNVIASGTTMRQVSVPEPSTSALLSIGLLIIAFAMRRTHASLTRRKTAA